MDWIQTLSIIVTVLASAYYIHRDIQQDMKTQTARTDRLYEMFCEIQKQLKDDMGKFKDEIVDMKKEQYEFMKGK